jgi:hypothetical protein
MKKTENKECEHEWVITKWVVNTREFKRPLERHCKRCGKKQSITYFGGDMWRWEDE